MDNQHSVLSVGHGGTDVHHGATVPADVGVELHLQVLEVMQAKVEWLWSRIDKFRMAWDDYAVGTREAFAALLLNRYNVFYEATNDAGPIGLLALNDVHVGHSANAHALFWDRSFRGREDFVRLWLRSMFKEFKLHRIAAFIPETNRPAWKFFRRLGMRIEGNLRKAGMHQGRHVDVIALAAIVEEM